MKEKTTAIVLAAGQGKRMHSKIQKQFLEIQGHPVLYYSLKCFQESPLIHDIIIVTGEDMISYCKREIVERYQLTKVSAVIAGGKERYDSVYKGLLACEECKYVFIHDGARPFITEEILERGMFGVQETGACVVGMPSKDTVKVADEADFVSETPDRKRVWTVQTPQIFSYDLIKIFIWKRIPNPTEPKGSGNQLYNRHCDQSPNLPNKIIAPINPSASAAARSNAAIRRIIPESVSPISTSRIAFVDIRPGIKSIMSPIIILSI